MKKPCSSFHLPKKNMMPFRIFNVAAFSGILALLATTIGGASPAAAEESSDPIAEKFVVASELRKVGDFPKLLDFLSTAEPKMRSNYRFAYFQASARFGMLNLAEGDYWTTVCETWMKMDAVPASDAEALRRNLEIMKKLCMEKLGGRFVDGLRSVSGRSGGSGIQKEIELIVPKGILVPGGSSGGGTATER